MEELLGEKFDETRKRQWIKTQRLSINNPPNAEEMVLSRMGDFLHEKFFKNYTLKQWRINPKELSPEITARFPSILGDDG